MQSTQFVLLFKSLEYDEQTKKIERIGERFAKAKAAMGEAKRAENDRLHFHMQALADAKLLVLLNEAMMPPNTNEIEKWKKEIDILEEVEIW